MAPPPVMAAAPVMAAVGNEYKKAAANLASPPVNA